MTDDDIRKERDAQYGPPNVSLGRIGIMWTEYLRQRQDNDYIKPICASDVAELMRLMKICRIAYPLIGEKAKLDAVRDARIYGDIADECRKKGK